MSRLSQGCTGRKNTRDSGKHMRFPWFFLLQALTLLHAQAQVVKEELQKAGGVSSANTETEASVDEMFGICL